MSQKLLAAPIAAVALLAGLPGPAGAATKVKSTRCSTKGLTFHTQRGAVNYADEVKNLVAEGTSCAKARSVARIAAKKALPRDRFPARIEGFRIHKRSLSPNAPLDYITATRGRARIIFMVQGL
jgi:hypothetical protein